MILNTAACSVAEAEKAVNVRNSTRGDDVKHRLEKESVWAFYARACADASPFDVTVAKRNLSASLSDSGIATPSVHVMFFMARQTKESPAMGTGTYLRLGARGIGRTNAGRAHRRRIRHRADAYRARQVSTGAERHVAEVTI